MEVNRELIDRFYKGECTDKEVREVMNWIHSELAEKQLSNEIEYQWQAVGGSEQQAKDWDNSLIKDKILHEIFKENDRKIHSWMGMSRWIAAAVILVFLSIGAYYFIANGNQFDTKKDAIAYVTKQNPRGQKSRVFLPDGSIVWLNSESSLTYPEKFDKSMRQIQLEGEAFFEVTKDPHKPFVVNAGNTATRVLGTKFNVSAYPEEPNIIIALEEGKIMVDQNIEGSLVASLMVEPGEGIIASQKENEMSKFKVDPQQFFAWKDGVLFFSKADMTTVIHTLERWYGVNISVHNFKKDNWSFTGSFKNEYLTNVLMSLSYTKDFSYEINDKNVIINIK